MAWSAQGRTRNRALDGVLVAQLGVVYDVARRLTGSALEAEDLTQETFGRAFDAVDRFEPGASPRAWLLAILHNLVRNRRRDRGRHREVELEDDGLAAPPPGEPEPRWAALRPELLDEAIAGLPPKLREVVVLRDLHGLKYAQLSEVLAVPVGTVMSRLHRGRAALRHALEHRLEAGAAANRPANREGR
jgi:RNA polymerase sigma-70 factor (ECF subfamily)